MPEENIFFLPVKESCRQAVVTCSPEDRLVEVAAVMRQRNISSVVVCEGGRRPASLPIGTCAIRWWPAAKRQRRWRCVR